LVATCGTQYVVSGTITNVGLVAAFAVGLLAVALLVINNLRDIPGDQASGKKTLAVRLGDSVTRRVYEATVIAAFVAIAVVGAQAPAALVGLAAAPLALAPVRHVKRGDSGRSLISVLGATARVQLVAGLLLAMGLVIAGF
jgi:1,4-dihydroxy-2-naphthoate octaprenyltransferase